MSRRETGAPTDPTAGIVPSAPHAGARATSDKDPLTTLDGGARRALAAVAERLIPAAHGMPSAAEVVDDERLRFVLWSRPDLIEPLATALRPELGNDPAARLAALEADVDALAALQFVIVAGYYTDRHVRQLIGYPGQQAISFNASERPPYVEEGLIDAVIARGPVWRDPSTGRRAARGGATRPEGGEDGPDRS